MPEMLLIFSKSARVDLKRLHVSFQRRILRKLRFYISQKEPVAFADKLTDSRVGQWRFRIGDYRALFDVSKDKVIILKIGHRKDIYS